MTVSELFVKLSITGADNAKRTLTSVGDGMSSVKRTSLETKAAILGSVYALEQMMATSARAGAAFSEFSAATGVSAQVLQRWQFAGRQFGETAEDVEASFKSVQATMTKMELTGSRPEGFDIIAQRVGFDPTKMRNPEYVLGQLQKFMQSGGDRSQALTFGKAVGASEFMLANMVKNAYDPAVLNRANVYTDKQIESLRKVNAQWSNLKYNIEKAFGNFTAAHGGAIVADITKVASATEKLVEKLVLLADKAGVFTAISEGMKNLGIVADMFKEKLDDEDKFKNLTDAQRAALAKQNLDQYEVAQGMVSADEIGEKQIHRAHIAHTQNFYGPAHPEQVKNASMDGLQKMLNEAQYQNSATSTELH